MTRNRIACCYFPTTALFLDDGVTFLKDLTLRLDERLPYKLFHNPRKAIQFLLHEYELKVSPNRWISDLNDREDLGELEADEFTHTFIDLNIFSIHQLVYDTERFSEVSVAVVDYAMPEMNGIEFFKSISSLPIKKIMLTGQASYELAVKAFNEGVIDRFILKGEGDFMDELNNAIAELQGEYFEDQSELMIENLIYQGATCLADPSFISLFNKFCEENHIVEYYLVKKPGSFLLLDDDKNVFWFVVQSSETMKEYLDIAEGNEAAASVIYSLREKEKLLFLFTKEDELNVPVSEWSHYMYPAEPLGSRYYYATLKGTKKYQIDTKKIFSYGEYLKKL